MTLRHPAYRRRELTTGIYRERVKLSSGCERKISSRHPCKKESTEAWHGGGSCCSTVEAAVIAVEGRTAIVRFLIIKENWDANFRRY